MPTIIALDVSLSMSRPIPNQPSSTGGSSSAESDNVLTYHQLAVQGINYVLDYLTKHARLEYVSLIIYSSLYEVVVDFTRDYDSIRNALHKIEHYDKTCLENVLVAVNNAFKAHWGSQNYCQIIFITDCGVGMGPSSLKNTIINLQTYKAACASAAAAAATTDGSKAMVTVGSNSAAIPPPGENQWVGFSYPSKLSFMCLGSLSTDSAFRCGTKLYMQLLEVSGQKGQLFIPRMKIKHEESAGDDASPITGDDGEDIVRQLTRTSALECFGTMCDINYRQFEATLRCGGYFRLEEPVTVWPAPLPYTARDVLGAETTKLMSRRLEVCGFLRMSDIGSPMSVSRHLILPRSVGGTVGASEQNESGKPSSNGGLKNGHGHSSAEERLEADIKAFYAKSDAGEHHQHEDHGLDGTDVNKESVCVLLHGALKVENMAALVLVGDNWYGFIYSYADGKKKWNLMLNVLPPGSDVVPWLGDLRYLGTLEDAFQGENPSFPIKADKRSYSQTIVVWIRHASLQSDIQKVLRHAKKLPEKTQHFYKELNRIRRAALSLGFVELLEGLAHIFEREISTLPLNASPDCSMQLTHAAVELRKTNNRDLKSVIHALPTQYNQLA
ncbi:integrator complex subunit 14 [Anopheles marshallii]|uniref:integrator complex subunit 14 n=1 Tax=Anopheles marshallii TaxID=1521116 RepID=UPI00237ABCA3|nr:integrator complex subunit 14 [Anopheles marshallii]